MEKDEKYSWLILFASFSSLTLSLGIPLSFGIFFTVLVNDFKNDNGKAEIAAVGSIAYGVLNLSSPLSSWLYRKYGCRFVVVLGGFIASLGLFLSYFASTIWFLYITYGILTGLGFGFIYAPSLAVLPDYFDKYRYFATSFATVGSALGTLVMPQVLLYLFEAFTWRGAMLIVSGLTMQTIVFGTLMRSKSKAPDRQTVKFWTFEKEMFIDVRFYLLCLDSFCFAGCSYTMFTMVNFLIGEKNLSVEKLASVIGGSNIVGRVVASIIGQLRQTNRPLFFSCVSLFCCLSSYATVLCTNIWSFGLCFVVFGFNYGIRISQVSGVLMDTFGVDKMAGAIGYYFFAGGVGASVIPPLVGIVADYSSISNAVITAATINLLDCILCFVVFSINSFNKRRKLLNENDLVLDN